MKCVEKFRNSRNFITGVGRVVDVAPSRRVTAHTLRFRLRFGDNSPKSAVEALGLDYKRVGHSLWHVINKYGYVGSRK